jgi:DNA primase
MSSRIPEATVDEILRRCDLVEVMGRYVQLRRTGRKYVALCPFHQEKTPSLHVDPEKGLWHCFGCKVGGTVLTFVQMMEGLNFREVALKMAAEVGIQVEISRQAAAEDSRRERAFNLLDRVAGYYHELLLRSPLGQPGREYLAERRISRETAERFRLGWAPGGGRALARKLEKAGFSRRESLEAGVLVERSSGLRDLLRDRLVFPICDTQGRVLAFGGRALGDVQPKYLNSPDSAFYSKRMHLYGIHLARGPISRGDQAVLVEGYFDVVSLHQAGFPRAVASLGTALTPEQANLLHRYTRTAVLAYDSDPAGQQATLKGAEILEEAGLRVLVATMPEGEDPDSLARKNPEALTEQIAAAVGVVEFQMDCLQRRIDLSTPEGKEDFVREVLPSIGRIRDSVRQDAYVRRLAYRTAISEQRLHWRLRRSRRKPEPVRHRARAFDVEEGLLYLCAANPEWIAVVREIISVEMISREEMRPLFSALLGLGERKEPVTLAEFLPHLQEEGMVSRLTEILAQEPLQSTVEDVRKLAVLIRDRALRERLEVLREEVLPTLNAGQMDLEDPLYQEYFQLLRHFHGRAMQ